MAQAEGTAVDWVLQKQETSRCPGSGEERTFRIHVCGSGRGSIDPHGPLARRGKAVGVFFLDSLTPGAYTERDVDLVDPVAQQLALAIENTRLFQEIEERAASSRSPTSTSRSFSPT